MLSTEVRRAVIAPRYQAPQRKLFLLVSPNVAPLHVCGDMVFLPLLGFRISLALGLEKV
jgi:hypothetical protein